MPIKKLNVFNSIAIYSMALIIFATITAGCSTSESVIKKTVGTYCNLQNPERQRVVRAYYDSITSPHKIRILCSESE